MINTLNVQLLFYCMILTIEFALSIILRFLNGFIWYINILTIMRYAWFNLLMICVMQRSHGFVSCYMAVECHAMLNHAFHEFHELAKLVTSRLSFWTILYYTSWEPGIHIRFVLTYSNSCFWEANKICWIFSNAKHTK